MCSDKFSKILAYDPKSEDIMDDKAYIFYVSMAKHINDLGNYQY